MGKAIIDYSPGVKIPNVIEGTAADRAGLRDGDLVLQVRGASWAGGAGAGVLGRRTALDSGMETSRCRWGPAE